MREHSLEFSIIVHLQQNTGCKGNPMLCVQGVELGCMD